EAVFELKTQTLKKSGLLSLHRGQDRFQNLGGLDALKAFCLRSLPRTGHADPLRRPRGVMLLSPPGCGKSQFAKALGNEVGRPTVTLDIGGLYGSLVGETERNVRAALRTIDELAPCVCFIDELEKSLSGAAGAQGDSGVSSRLFGSVLTWMNDRTSDVYLVGTCNDVSKLPPEFTRAERWDAIFFLDLPGALQRRSIWDLYLELFQLDRGQPLPDDTAFTGAEIRACCRLAALLDVPVLAAAQNVVPVAVTAAESVQRLRTWAGGRCLDADNGGVYGGGKSPIKRRRVQRRPADPSAN
ncbi:MAG: AAA family ATPase, partial [Planctomycetales bacterium]|nr:AAA family ATPase [Planctomycetales bacterium]